MAVGIGRAAYEHAEAFVRDNYTAGRPIPRYGRMLARLCDMERKLRAADLLCWKAAAQIDHGQQASLAAAISKAYAPKVALESCSLAMEILGDAGVVKDQLVEKFFRDVKALDIVEGTGQIQRLVIARRLVDLPRN